MIKTSSFISVFLFILVLCITHTHQAVLAENGIGEIRLNPIKKHQIKTLKNQASIYFPKKLLIGKPNKFVIKGVPGSQVSIAVSNSGYGAKPDRKSVV